MKKENRRNLLHYCRVLGLIRPILQGFIVFSHKGLLLALIIVLVFAVLLCSFSNFRTNSVLERDILNRISGGPLGPKRFQFRGKFQHTS